MLVIVVQYSLEVLIISESNSTIGRIILSNSLPPLVYAYIVISES